MPSEIEIYGDLVLFGIRIAFRANDQRALAAALAIYPEWTSKAQALDAVCIYVVLTAYDVNLFEGEVHQVEGASLAIQQGGMSARADGGTRSGECQFGHDFDAALFADLVNTMVLFLIGHAGRVPLHASAVMLGEVAIVFAGASGSGKSTLALAANRAGLPLLSDDTIFVQTEPCLRLWSLAGPIHVFEKDTAEEGGGMRFRGGRWKKALPAGAHRHMADCAILCVLSKGEAAALMPMQPEDAVAALTMRPEPGYQFYGEASRTAARALAGGGAWSLSLSADPGEAIALIRSRFAVRGGIGFHRDYVALVGEIERRFAVARWKCGDADLWPLARFDLYLDMYWDSNGTRPPRPRALALRVIGRMFKPLLTVWRSRRDLRHWLAWPKPAPLIFLGDGVSLDCIDGAYQDRQGEPLMQALEKRGQQTFLMQAGESGRLPWRRATFAANIVEAWGWILSPLFARRVTLPDHGGVMALLAAHGVHAPSLGCRQLRRRARLVRASAFLFEGVLRRVRPKMALLTSYYAGLGPAFVLACRRQGILSADIQHAPLEGAPMAYRFSAYPQAGYSTLPALFWSWTQKDADAVRPHASLYGGPPQLAAFGHAQEPVPEFDGAFAREILVALQPIAGHRADWEALAEVIEAAPSQWRWWIRRHPASRPDQDAEYGRLLSLRLPQVKIAEASALPLPVLLPRMSVVLSLASGTAMEAAMFGVPAFFLSEEARGPFGAFIAGGGACVIGLDEIQGRIENLKEPKSQSRNFPDLDTTLTQLEILAADYALSQDRFRDCVNQAPARCEEGRKPV